MDLYKNIRTIEQNLFSLDCEINNQSLFFQFDDKAWFMGLFLGLAINDELVCAITIYREDGSDITRYLNDVRSNFKKYGSVERYALYRLSNGKIVAVKYNKRLVIRRSKLDKTSAPNYEPFQSKKQNTLVLKIYEESFSIFSESNPPINLGALTQVRHKNIIKPLYIFDRVRLTNAMLIEFVNLVSSHGDLVSGEIKMSYIKWQRYMLVLKNSKELEKLKDIHLKKFTLYEDYMHNVYVTDHNRMTRPQVLVGKNRLIQKHYEVGEYINPDWFGREFGFFINSVEEKRVYGFEPFPNRKAVEPIEG